MPRTEIQPKYFAEAKFICTTCDNQFVCGTTKGEEVRVDVCSNCHPFYIGTQQFASNAGRAEQFKSKFARKEEIKSQVEKESAAQIAKNKEAEKAKKN